MAVYNYDSLFEDEVAEVLRSAGRYIIIRSGLYTWKSAHALYDDGMIASGAGYFIEYHSGRGYGIVNTRYLTGRLAHESFTVTEV